MSEMIERVADVLLNWGCGTSDECEKIARASIAAMREMTPAMKRLDASLAEGWNTAIIPPTRYAPLGSHTGASWEQLVDEALK